MTRCSNCGIPVGNRLVVMKDNSICCYTCGRLRSEINIGRDIMMFARKAEILEERRQMYWKAEYGAG